MMKIVLVVGNNSSSSATNRYQMTKIGENALFSFRNICCQYISTYAERADDNDATGQGSSIALAMKGRAAMCMIPSRRW